MPEQPEVSAQVVRAVDRPIVVVPLLVLIAAIGGLFRSFTLTANLLVLAVGGTMVWLSLSGRAARRPAPRALTRDALWWLIPVLVLGLTEFYAFLNTPRAEYPTVSFIFDPMFERYLPRTAGYLAWLAGFWALVRR
jgi:hypothetical protein